ncbi:hypothetical protein [Sphingobium sp.]|uniref:hypothetical protein n=1 Tax=Sphingobium sp. TaxID=1912891 RepID=UPI0028BE269D|nr:hypothetical protein [Sphingobium sp.]
MMMLTSLAIVPDDRAIAKIALFTACLLRNVDAVALRDLGDALAVAAGRGCIPRYADNSQLVRIMQRLGWRKDGYAGGGNRRSPRYVRISAAVEDLEQRS